MKITVITVCLNAAKTIRTALESIAGQRTEDGARRIAIEHIVVDGGSTDGTAELIREYADRGGKGGDFSVTWVSERDRGLYDAINKGIRMSTGDVIGICNADDVLAEDDTIVKIARAFADGETCGEADAVYADVRFVRPSSFDLDLGRLRAARTTRYCTGRFFRNWMFRFAAFPAHPSTFVRRTCFAKYGFYSLDYRICADFEMMLRLFYKNRIPVRYLPICTHVMRMGGVSTGGFRSNVQINREDLRALEANGVWSCLPLVYLKYFAKIWGFVFGRLLSSGRS